MPFSIDNVIAEFRTLLVKLFLQPHFVTNPSLIPRKPTGIFVEILNGEMYMLRKRARREAR